MKIRNGFVSNSSVSSFCIDLKDLSTNRILLTDKQMKVLNDYGCQLYNGFRYGIDVSCNQDEVIYFLLYYKIPFTASCHYGHYSVVYNPVESNIVYTIQNYGSMIAMYGLDQLQDIDVDKLIVKEKDFDWLKKNKKLWGFLDDEKHENKIDAGEYRK